MPEQIPYPGVYVEEVSFRNTIGRLITTNTAFVGSFSQGAANVPISIDTPQTLSTVYGGDAASTATGRAVELFLANGGTSPLVVRTMGADPSQALASLAEGINLLVLPDTATTGTDAATAIATAQDWAQQNRAIYLLDPPPLADPVALGQWLSDTPLRRDANTAVYYPYVVNGGIESPCAGAVAGVVVRTDLDRGVWKAPAGVGADLRGVDGVSYPVNDQEQESLTRFGVNPIRNLGSGPVLYGARTLSSDPEWKYLSMRRIALLIEASIEKGTRWAVFEPNDEPLWASLRQATDDFLDKLWREGALQGEQPKDAFFVKCGQDTMTPDDIDNGRLIIQIGFAPLRPAEFVIIRIQQKTSMSIGLSGKSPARLLRQARSVGGAVAHQVLFAGRSGTGKSVAASGLAEQLGRPLVRIDLSQLASKYIGETEKNLSRLMEQAAKHQSILFFDEADALFGKRAKVRDSHDRYANQEVSHLLSMIESYPGLVVLSVTSARDLGRKRDILRFRR